MFQTAINWGPHGLRHRSLCGVSKPQFVTVIWRLQFHLPPPRGFMMSDLDDKHVKGCCQSRFPADGQLHGRQEREWPKDITMP